MPSKLLAKLTSRCSEAWDAAFGPMTGLDWFFLFCVAWLASLLASLAWVLFAT
ncbi:hypothetical protein [Bradyrhizobium sp. DASA03120]|uniref:hypothetical protein n=1 Tax=Bradyrhizobium sp. SMVTL-02 TaxID=3395917 RepID=UPI003F72D489